MRGELSSSPFDFLYLPFLFNNPHSNKAMKPLFLESQDHVPGLPDVVTGPLTCVPGLVGVFSPP